MRTSFFTGSPAGIHAISIVSELCMEIFYKQKLAFLLVSQQKLRNFHFYFRSWVFYKIILLDKLSCTNCMRESGRATSAYTLIIII